MDTLTSLISEHFTLVLIAASILVGMCLRAVTKIAMTAFCERSRREIAAYIAEGSITPEHGERLIRANVSSGRAVP